MATRPNIKQIRDANYTFDTLADLLAVKFLTVGDIVSTTGYNLSGDSGGNTYKVVAAGTGTHDNGSYIDHPNSGVQLRGLFPYGVAKDVQFGFDKSASTDCTSIIQGLVDAGFKRVSLTGGTHIFNFDTNGAARVTLPSDIQIEMDQDCIIKPTSDSAVTSVSDEMRQYVFYAEDKNGIKIFGGQFDGNKGDIVDPAAGLIKFVGCSDSHVHHIDFYDSSKDASGLVFGESWNGAVNKFCRNIHVYRNSFERCSWGITFRNLFTGIKIYKNNYSDGKLSAPNTGIARYGTTVYPGRAIRLTGYINGESSSADGDIGSSYVTGNTIESGTYGIEVWNQDATVGRNPENAKNIIIGENIITALYGIGSNSWSGVTISKNVVSHLSLSAAQMSAYAGDSSLTDTSASAGNDAGTLIEARPGFNITVSGNSLTTGWSPSGTDYTASSIGIALGTNDKNIRCEATVTGNDIIECYRGMQFFDMQETMVSGNTIRGCSNAIFSISGTNTYGRSGNTLKGNKIFSTELAASNNKLVVLMGDWEISGNELDGNKNDPISSSLLRLEDTSSDCRIFKNSFVNFAGNAVYDAALTSDYNGNEYDAGAGAGSNGAVTFERQNNKTVRIGQEVVFKANAAFGWSGAAATGESYEANEVLVNGNTTSFNVSVSSGTIYDLGAFCGVRSSAPVSGYWSQDCIFYLSSAVAGGSIGTVCTASGISGTWKSWGSIAV